MSGAMQWSKCASLLALSLGTVLHRVDTPASASTAFPHPDLLSSTPWWINKVKAQAVSRHGQQYQGCLFGDSISAGLGHSLGRQVANFSQGGLSSASLLTQLKIVKASRIHCQQVVVAVGTNDAWYRIRNAAFIRNMSRAIALTRALGADEIVLVPAFYSTLAASRNPTVAGPIGRVDQINRLMMQVASAEQVDFMTTGLETLFQKHSLKPQLTFDGVHLNEAGKSIYRKFLTQLFRLQIEDNAKVNLGNRQNL
jgi:lysophospholipase L1-like esterase